MPLPSQVAMLDDAFDLNSSWHVEFPHICECVAMHLDLKGTSCLEKSSWYNIHIYFSSVTCFIVGFFGSNSFVYFWKKSAESLWGTKNMPQIQVQATVKSGVILERNNFLSIAFDFQKHWPTFRKNVAFFAFSLMQHYRLIVNLWW